MRKILKYPWKGKRIAKSSGDLDTLFKISDRFKKEKIKNVNAIVS